jgi:short-subunit dehydrogenase
VLTICPGVVATNFQKRAGSVLEEHQGAMSASFVAEQIWKQIERLKPLSIVDWKYRLLTFLSYFIPLEWTLAVQERIIAERITPRNLIKIKQ